MTVAQPTQNQAINKDVIVNGSSEAAPEYYIGRNRSIPEAWGKAMSGILGAFKTERIFRLHFSLIGGGALIALFLRLTAFEWALALAIATIILAAELFNTAVERVTDLLVGYQYHRLARESKDISAGAVLVTLLGSGVVIIFLFAHAAFRLFAK